MTDLLGQIIGNCRIEAPLGKGGMGHVFRARHVHLDRLQAIKVMHPNLVQDEEFQARFRQEAKAIAALNHQHIVEIFDFGEQDRRYYLVMEFLPEGSLRLLLDRRAKDPQAWSLKLGLDLIRQAADGLAYAHARGIVHRDIKPDNLLLLRRVSGSRGSYMLKVSDFGFARLLEGSGMTASGVVLGTPAYMSPEQCQGMELTALSDVYSLGVVLYEVATGLLPFATTTISEAVHKHVHVEPPPPRSVRPDLPESVEEVILRCLAKDPQDRFARATELSEALRALLGMRAAEKPSGFPEGTAPFVVVMDGASQPLQVTELTTAGLTVGRLANNSIVLNDATVSRNHLVVEWNGQRAKVKDLGARAGTFLDGTVLLPQTAQRWEPGQKVTVGPYTLTIEPRLVDKIGVMLPAEYAQLSLTPNQPIAVPVTLINRTRTPDEYAVTIEGLPAIRIEETPSVQVAAGGQASVTLRVTTLPSTESRADEYSVTIRARSRQNPNETGALQTRWSICPYSAGMLTLKPDQARGVEQATYSLQVSNTGNAPTRFLLSVDEVTPGLTYVIQPTEVAIEPGATVHVPLTVRAKRRVVGVARQHTFTVQARAGAAAPSTQGRFTQAPVIPIWAFPLAIGAMILVLLWQFV